MATSAHVKPSGQRPPGPVGNTTGLIVPQTEPHVSGGSTKPPIRTETPAEDKSWLDRVRQKGGEWVDKAQELLDKGEIKALADAKEQLNALIDRGVEASGYNPVAMVGGAVAKAVVTVMAPDNVIDLVPGGKLVTGAEKVERTIKGLNRAEDAARASDKSVDSLRKAGDVPHAGRTEVKSAEAAGDAGNAGKGGGGNGGKGADGNGGGHGKSTKRKPRPCELMKYKDMDCDGEKHHVLPDFTMRISSSAGRFDPSMRIPGTPSYDNAPVICLDKAQHNGLHKSTNRDIALAGRARNGAISAGELKQISVSEAAKRSGCNPKNIGKQVNRMVKMPDEKLLRGVVDSRKVGQDLVDLLRGGKD